VLHHKRRLSRIENAHVGNPQGRESNQKREGVRVKKVPGEPGNQSIAGQGSEKEEPATGGKPGRGGLMRGLRAKTGDGGDLQRRLPQEHEDYVCKGGSTISTG